MRIVRRLLALALLPAALAACADDDTAVEVRMLDNTFAPSVVRIDPGEAVRFTTVGVAPHNAIADDETWSTEDDFGDLAMYRGDSAVVRFDAPGVYDYFCSFHATRTDDGYEGMVGTIVVGDVADPAEIVGGGTAAPTEWSGRTVRVPEDYPTIQSGVDAAEAGDLVLVGPGTYRESVSVTTPGVTIRGTDRNTVVLDGELTRENGIFVTADGVAIENLTARGYTVNGFFWSGVTGYRGSYLTAYDNWVYGIYAFDSVDGLFEHSYASGAYDAGFYIGQCDPCNAVIRDSMAEYNGLGYSGTNASREIYIVGNEFAHNMGGIVPNSLDSELLPPVNHVYIGGNLVRDSGAPFELTPFKRAEYSAFGNGILLAGSVGSVVERNLIINSRSSGVMVVSNIDANLWPSSANRVVDNTILGSGRADISIGGPAEGRSCVSGDGIGRTVPGLLRWLHDCDGLNLPMPYGLATSSEPLGRIVEYNFGKVSPLSHGDAPDPTLDFDQLPGGADAEVRPAVGVFAGEAIDTRTIPIPDIPEGTVIAEPNLVVLGVDLTAGMWPVILGALLWWVPLAVWVLGGLWALASLRHQERWTATRWVWAIVIVGLPAIGVVLFGLFGTKGSPIANRLLGTGLGLVLWVGAVVGILLAGGVF